jgi:hypothetical protein
MVALIDLVLGNAALTMLVVNMLMIGLATCVNFWGDDLVELMGLVLGCSDGEFIADDWACILCLLCERFYGGAARAGAGQRCTDNRCFHVNWVCNLFLTDDLVELMGLVLGNAALTVSTWATLEQTSNSWYRPADG